MKKPSLKNLKFDTIQTRGIRKAMSSQKSIKITINIDAKTLIDFRNKADESGIPYQRLINRTLIESLQNRAKVSTKETLKRLEKELKFLKDKLAA